MDARLIRDVHVSNAWCQCQPTSDLHAQAQAQPRELSFEVVCVEHAVHALLGSELFVLALSTNGLILRLKNTRAPEEPEAGDYFLEWPAAPGDSKDSQPFRVACMSISPDLHRLLCVTSDGNAHVFQVLPPSLGGATVPPVLEMLVVSRQVLHFVRAASRVYDEGPSQQVQWANPLGPSLLAYSMDPR
jgi:hypothetical protein